MAGSEKPALIRKLAPPPDGRLPRLLTWRDLRAEAITRDHLADDVAGINASLDLIARTRGGGWPTGPVSAEGNFVDLVWHEAEFRDASSYTYVLYDATGTYLGCCYLYPMGRRTPYDDSHAHHDVDVSWWVTPAAYDAGWYEQVYEALRSWLEHDLWFRAPYFSNAELPA